MRSSGLSIAGLIALIALLAVGLACLRSASSPWAELPCSALLALLTVAPLLAAYRGGRRRAFWTGLAVCGTSYLALSSAPGFSAEVGPRLLTSRLLRWAYPLVIPEQRRASDPNERKVMFSLSGSSSGDRVGGLSRATIEGGRVDVIVEGAAGTPPVAADLEVAEASFGGGQIPAVQLRVTAPQLARLNRAESEGKSLAIRRLEAQQTGGTWRATPVAPEDFSRVGHSFIGIICATLGGLFGQYLHATWDRSPSGSP